MVVDLILASGEQKNPFFGAVVCCWNNHLQITSLVFGKKLVRNLVRIVKLPVVALKKNSAISNMLFVGFSRITNYILKRHRMRF